MKAKIICISDNVLLGKKTGAIAALSKQLFLAGFFLEGTVVLPAKERIISKQLELCLADNTAIFVLAASEGQGKPMLGNAIAALNNDKIVKNDFAFQAVMRYFGNRGLVATQESEKEYFFPSISRAIVNGSGLSQGYVTDIKQTPVFVLPFAKQEVLQVVKDAVLPFLAETIGYQTQVVTLKTFGISAQDLASILKEEIKNKQRVSVSFFQNGPLVDIVLKAKKDNQFIEMVTQAVFQKTQKFIYAEQDISLQEACFNLLCQTKQTLSIAESITCGEVASSLIKNNQGASKIVLEAVVAYTDTSKIDTLGVSAESLFEHTAVSSQVAYEMAAGMLAKTGSDLVVATTGYANHENHELDGVCYVAVGNANAIHIFKNKFFGTREENIEAATASALFYLMKKLRKNDFHFEKTVV